MRAATLLFFSATAYGVAFHGPEPTPVKALYEDLHGWTPKPTDAPRALPELFRRQQKSNSGVCGYLDGDSDFVVSCSAGACIFDTTKKWFGCCTNTASCDNMVTKCINSASVSSCLGDTSCYNDPLAIACTESANPSCINMYAKISAGTMNHWVCGSSATSIAVLASTSASSSASVKPSTTKPSTSADATPYKQNGGQSSGAGAGGLIAATAGVAASSATPSTGGAPSPMPTVQALLGVACGLAGAFAIFL